MEEITLNDEEIATYAKLFKYREVSKDKFFLTFYNGHLEAFYKFLVHIIRKHFRHLDCFSNAQMLNANYLVKHHGTPCGIYHGSWLSGLRRGGANSEWRKPPQVRILPSPLHLKKN